jgi:hypothetical protein
VATQLSGLIRFHTILGNHHLRTLDELRKLIEASISREETSAAQRAKELYESVESEQEKAQLDDWTSEEHFLLNTEYPRLARSAFLVSVYSLMETWLMECCRTAKRVRSSTSELKRKNGDMLTRVNKHLMEVASIKSLTNSRSWQRIRDFEDIRHCIVHRNGRPESPNEERLTKQYGIYSSEYLQKTLVPTASYCADQVKLVGAFFDEVHEAIKEGDQ